MTRSERKELVCCLTRCDMAHRTMNFVLQLPEHHVAISWTFGVQPHLVGLKKDFEITTAF